MESEDHPTQVGAWVVYGGVPWESPWLNDQQLAFALSREQPVLYVEPAISPATWIRRGQRDWLGLANEPLRPGLRRTPEGVSVLRTMALPPVSNDLARRASAPLLHLQIRRALERLGLRDRAVLAMTPPAARLRGVARESLFIAFVSDWLEAGSSLLGRPQARLAAESRELWHSADLVCVTSPPLGERLAEEGVASALLPHGFDDSLAELYATVPEPPAYAGAGHPRFLVAGRLDERLDVPGLCRVADEWPDGRLFLVGPVSPLAPDGFLDELLGRPNVTGLPTCRREELPAYLVHVDCLLIPYLPSEWNDYCSPLKLWDYLYAGPPIVASGCPVLTDLPGWAVRTLARDEPLADGVRPALDAGRDDDRRRRAYAAENTWRERAGRLRVLAAEAMPSVEAGTGRAR